MPDFTGPLTHVTPFSLTLPSGAQVNPGGTVSADLTASGLGAALVDLSNVDPETGRDALGATATGTAIYTAADAEAARTAIGATATGDALIIATDADAARTAIGAPAAADVTLKADVWTFGPVERALLPLGNGGFGVTWMPGFAGTLTRVSAILLNALSVGDSTTEVTVDGIAVTTSAPLTFLELDPPGTALDVAVTAGGAFTANQRIGIIPNGTNELGNGSFILEYTRA
jgi:hypothetical protein